MFTKKLTEIGADFPESFVKNMDRLIVQMHPKYKRKAAKAKAALASSKPSDKTAGIADEQKALKARKFPGLSVPDQEWTPVDKFLQDRSSKEVVEILPPSLEVDDTFSQLAAIGSRRNRPSAEDFMENVPPHKRMRNGEGSGNGYGGDNGYGARGGDRGYGGGNERGRSTRPVMDERPVLYKIYDGSVSNVRDFGAFVSLEGIQGRVEGG